MIAWNYGLLPGAKMPQDCGYLILSGLSRKFPWIHGRSEVQIAPVRGERVEDGLIRTDSRSILHIRGISNEEARQLSNAWFVVDGAVLALEAGQRTEIQPYPRLASRLTILEDTFDIPTFLGTLLERVAQKDATIEVGRQRSLQLQGHHFLGWSVALDHLSPQTSVRVQEQGLGRYTSMGCGVFGPGWKKPPSWATP